MPLFKYLCQDCKKPHARLLPASKANDPGPCPSCGGVLVREASGPSQQVIERLDNGLMPKAVEQLADSPRLVKERKEGVK